MRTPRRDLLLFVCGVFLLGAAREFDRLLTNLRLREVGFSDTAIGSAVAAHQLGMLLAALPVALLLGRLSIRLLLSLATLLGASGLLLVSAAETEALAWAGELALGAALAIPFVSSFPFILERASRRRRTLWIGAVPAAFALAGMLVSPLAGAIAVRFSFARAMVIGAAVSLIALPFFAAIRSARPMPLSTNRLAFLRPARRWLAVGFLTGLGTGLCVPFLNLLFHDRARLDASMIGTAFAIAHLGVVLGYLFAAAWERRLGLRRGIIAGELASGAMFLAMGLFDWAPLLVAAAVLRGLAMALSFPIYKKAVLECVPEDNRRHIAGASSFIWNGAMVLGGFAGGVLLEHSGFTLLFGTAAAACLAAALLVPAQTGSALSPRR